MLEVILEMLEVILSSLPILKYKVDISVGDDSGRQGFIVFHMSWDLKALFQSKILLNEDILQLDDGAHC